MGKHPTRIVYAILGIYDIPYILAWHMAGVSMGSTGMVEESIGREPNPVDFYKCLADELRLKSVLLIAQEGELCVCELVDALAVSQPKVSRHLAQLRQVGLLQDRRQGQWVFYRLHPALPEWMQRVLNETSQAQQSWLHTYKQRLQGMDNRPKRCG